MNSTTSEYQKGRFDTHIRFPPVLLHWCHMILLAQASGIWQYEYVLQIANYTGPTAMDGNQSDIWNCRIDSSGRIVLPLPLRNEKQLESGDELIVTLEDGDVVLRTYDQVIARLQKQFSETIPDGVSLVDELLADRRREAQLEKGR